MNKLIVEKIYQNEVEYDGCMNDKCKKSKKRGCECGLGYIKRRFTAYKIQADDGNYYRLKGYGADGIHEGDEITGTIEEEAWEKDGKSGIQYTLILPKKEEALQNEVEELKKKLAEVESKNEEEDIPFN